MALFILFNQKNRPRGPGGGPAGGPGHRAAGRTPPGGAGRGGHRARVFTSERGQCPRGQGRLGTASTARDTGAQGPNRGLAGAAQVAKQPRKGLGPLPRPPESGKSELSPRPGLRGRGWGVCSVSVPTRTSGWGGPQWEGCSGPTGSSAWLQGGGESWERLSLLPGASARPQARPQESRVPLPRATGPWRWGTHTDQGGGAHGGPQLTHSSHTTPTHTPTRTPEASMHRCQRTRTRGTSEAQRDRGTPSTPAAPPLGACTSPRGGHGAAGQAGREARGPRLSSWRRQAWGRRRLGRGSRPCRASASKRTQPGLPPGEDQPLATRLRPQGETARPGLPQAAPGGQSGRQASGSWAHIGGLAGHQGGGGSSPP